MKNKTQKSLNLGALTILVVFTVLCLTVFSVLSLASAEADSRLTGRNTQQAKRYYEADNLAEEFLSKIGGILAETEQSDPEAIRARFVAELGNGFDSATDQAAFAVPVSNELRLTVQLQLTLSFPSSMEVLEWKTENVRDLPPDDHIPLWVPEE